VWGRGSMREARRGRRQRVCERGCSSRRGQCRRARELVEWTSSRLTLGLLGLLLLGTAAEEAAEEKEHAPRTVRYVCMTQQSTQQWREGNVRTIHPTLPNSLRVRMLPQTSAECCSNPTLPGVQFRWWCCVGAGKGFGGGYFLRRVR